MKTFNEPIKISLGEHEDIKILIDSCVEDIITDLDNLVSFGIETYSKNLMTLSSNLKGYIIKID